MAREFHSEFFQQIFPVSSLISPEYQAPPEFAPKMPRIVGIPLKFQICEPKIFSCRFSAYQGRPKNGPVKSKMDKHWTSLVHFRLADAEAWFKIR